MTGKKWLGVLGLLALSLGIAGWFGHARALSWYYAWHLVDADDDRDTWARQAASLGSAAVDDLLRCLRRDDDKGCANGALALSMMAEDWGPDDERTAALVEELADQFDNFSVAGKQAALELASKECLPFSAVLLTKATMSPETRTQAMKLACRAKLGPDLRESCKKLAASGLKDASPATRVEAIELAFRCGIPEQAVALLRDRDAAVRRAAIVRLGPAADVIATDELLYWLHDSDQEVSRLCESALRGRGLLAEHLHMGRLITDPRTNNRLRVLDLLDQNAAVEPGIWLRRLSHDPSPAVRAASIRAACEHILVDLTDRIEQMAANDPSPTVRQLARFYLNSQVAP